jgi:hypothetical protein
MAKLYNLARMLTPTTGTGTVTLDSAVLGHLTFDQAGVQTGDRVSYGILDGANSEVGRGVYDASGPSLTRSVLKSTNSDAAINLSGSAQVIITALAEDIPDYRNRVINPQLFWAQAGVGSVADGAYTGIDQWYALTQTGTVTSSQLTSVADGLPSMGRLTQSQASAQRMGWAQVFESSFVKDLRGKTVTLAAKVRMSAATTLRYAIIEWTGTADSVTKDVVASWTNTTFTAGQFFSGTSLTITGTGSVALSASTVTDITLSASISSSMNNIIIFFWTDSAQAQTVTLDLGNVFFGQGASAPATFDPPPPDVDFRACQRYYWQIPVGTTGAASFSSGFCFSTTNALTVLIPPVPFRVLPSLALSNVSHFGVFVANGGGAAATALTLNVNSTAGVVRFDITTAGGLVAGNATLLVTNNASAAISLSARL